MESRPYYIYTLNDPRNNEVRYVGCTINPKSRYSLHLNEKRSNNRKDAWILELKDLNTLPIMVIHVRTGYIEKAILFEKLIFEQFDFGNLLCNNPQRSPYVKKHDVERLSVENTKEFSSIIFRNIQNLCKINNVAEKDINKKSMGASTFYKMRMNPNHIFVPHDIWPIAKYFNVPDVSFIKENFDYSSINLPTPPSKR